MRHRFIPLIVFLAGAAVSTLAWRQSRSHEREALALRGSLTAAQTSLRLDEFIHTRIRVAETIAASFPSSHYDDEASLHAVAGPVVEQFGGLLAINWIDPSGVIRWVCPPGPNAAARGRDLTRHPIASGYLQAARRSGRTKLTRPLRLYQGGMGFVAYIPIGGDPDRYGFLNAVFRTSDMVRECLADGLAPYYAWRITCGEDELARSDGAAPAPGFEAVSRTLRIGPATWSVQLYPTRALVEEVISPTATYLLASGLGLSLALALLLGLLIERRARRLRLEAERREFQARMAHLQKLESLGVLAGGIAHDFNNLLLTIMGNAELARERPDLDEDLADALDEILVAARHAADLSRQMLIYSGGGRAEVRVIDLAALLDEMEPLLRASVGRTRKLDLFVRDELPALRGDPSQIRQIVLNLLVNAAEASPDDGTVTVRVYTAHADRSRWNAPHNPDDLPAGPYAVVEVEDHGCGMPPEVVERVFDPFFSTKFAGRGLGMATVLGIVRAHRGAITIDSEPGRGTTVRVFLPVATDVGRAADAAPDAPADDARFGRATPSAAAGTAEATGSGTRAGVTEGTRADARDGAPHGAPRTDRPARPAATRPAGASRSSDRSARRALPDPLADRRRAATAGNRPRVLVVDDDDAVRTLAQRMLEVSGFDACGAASGFDALSLIAAHGGDFDCVLLDLSMPGMDGHRVMDEMHARGWRIPVVLSSGLRERAMDDAPANGRPVAFVAKPYQRAALVEAVRMAIESRAPAPTTGAPSGGA